MKFTGETVSSSCRVTNATTLFVVRRDAADAGHGTVPPLLVQQEPLVDHIEGQPLPGFAAKPLILRQRLDAGGTLGLGSEVRQVDEKPDRLAQALFAELLTLSRRRPKMDRPIGIREPEGGGRNAKCEASHAGVEQPVDAGRGIDLIRDIRRRRSSCDGGPGVAPLDFARFQLRNSKSGMPCFRRRV
jgi:hypothetical protein